MSKETLEKLKKIKELLEEVIEEYSKGGDEEQPETQDTINPDPKPPKP